FGEEVPLMEMALQTAFTADIFIVIGTSLNVYPAANIINYLNKKCLRYLIDPEVPTALNNNGWIIIKDNAVNGMEILFKKLTKKEPLNSGSK
ncbi:MAG: NAD-dependent protein deacylase, partial [Bacteroidetes bacterium]